MHLNLEVLKDWISDMAETIAQGQSKLEGKLELSTKSIEKSMKTLPLVNEQLDTLKALVFNALQVIS